MRWQVQEADSSAGRSKACEALLFRHNAATGTKLSFKECMKMSNCQKGQEIFSKNSIDYSRSQAFSMTLITLDSRSEPNLNNKNFLNLPFSRWCKVFSIVSNF